MSKRPSQIPLSRGVSRRSFVKQAALASGATALGAPFALADEQGKVAPSERINLGFIGLGGMGSHHLQWFSQQPDVQIAAVCDVDASRVAAAKESLKINDEQTYSDFRELVSSDSIDAVLIATPDHWHGLAAIAAARAGKAIYCEKPLTNSIGEGRSLCKAVEAHNVVLQTGSHERSNPGAGVAKKLIAEGRFGKIHTVRIQLPTDEPHLQSVKDFQGTPPATDVPEGLDYNFWLGYTPEVPYTEKRCHFWWRFISSYGGGEMTDRGCHVIDLAQYILNNDATGPTKIEATGTPAAEDCLYDACLDFKFENHWADGLKMIGNNEGPRGVWFEGSEGKLFVAVHGAELTAEPASLLQGVEVPKEPPYAKHRREFLEAIKTGSPVVAPAEAGHRTATICHLNNIALRLGRGFDWDPTTERSNDDEVSALLTPEMRAPWSL
ncbi:Gfo/Idh/MocA family protein [Adhaeretor mobilis]|uniref:Inositol 2-dehydrogenase n=1 Tax=Adhaeretor mobilis TaxID=1930276 RepID=A0A517N0Q2_9BACT|nr:Gfo/Idh/MocA family oxidoreductase [Adhaeretor mobilis]QDT00715.1 Inositol 2-dehydrogenase [Adhaeretor mobilis]